MGVGLGYADVAQISRGIAGGNVKGATERDCQMLKIAAHAGALGKDIQSRLR